MQFKKIMTAHTKSGTSVTADNLSLQPQMPYYCSSCGNPLHLRVTHDAGRCFVHDLENPASDTLKMCAYLLPASQPSTKPLTHFELALYEHAQRNEVLPYFPRVQHYFCVLCKRDYHGHKCCLYCHDRLYTTEVIKRDSDKVKVSILPLSVSHEAHNRYFAHLMLSTSLATDSANASVFHITKDNDRLTEPYLLLHTLTSELVAHTMNQHTLPSIGKRLLATINDWQGIRTFHPVLQHCANLLTQTEKTAMKDPHLHLKLMQNLANAYHEKTHQQAMNDWIQEAYQYRSAAYRWLTEFQVKHPCFMMVGIELAYQQNDLPVEKVIEDFQQFLHTARANEPLSQYLGVCWHLEYGKLKGYFLHALFFFPLIQANVTSALGKCLGDHWQQSVTDSCGYYRINETEQAEYQYPGYLTVSNEGPSRLDEVKWVLTVMTEMDFCSRLILPENIPIMGMIP